MRCLGLLLLLVPGMGVMAADNAGTSPAITGVVSLTPELALQMSGRDIVYIYARDSQTRALTLATWRTTVRKLPLRFTLDDSLAPSPDRQLSDYRQIDLIARVSRNPASAKRGPDMMGVVEGVSNTSSGVELVIDTLMTCGRP